MQIPVRDHIPLEQGLRQGTHGAVQIPPHQVRDHIPLEQGLRPKSKKIFLYHLRVRDHIPLEQGLRLE